MIACRVLIAEDEPLAREQLERLVLRHERLELLGTVVNGTDAIDRIDELKPDAVFLDIRMPGASGIEVVRRIRHRPYVVFTTAYDEFAVTAFELQALDYLLKPFGKRRFDRMVERLLQQDRAAYVSRLSEGLDQSPIRRLFVRSRSSAKAIAVDDIIRIEAADDYSRIVVLEELIRHINARGDVWFATHEESADYVRAQAGME